MSENLSEKIASILSAAPASFDPEDDVQEETVARVVSDKVDGIDSDEGVSQSQFRKQNVSFLEDVDNRYKGKSSSRKQLRDSDSEDENSLNDLEESKSDSNDEVNDSVDIDEEPESDLGLDDSFDDDSDANTTNENETFKHLDSSDVPNQINKGLCVRNQLNIWENLLEMRIQMQKCLLTANKFPQTDVFNDLKHQCGIEFTNKVAESKSYVVNLLNKLLHLQELLLKKYPETRKLLSGNNSVTQNKTESDEEIPSDTEDEQDATSNNDDDDDEEIPQKKRKIDDYSAEIDKRYKLYKDYKNSVIQKWNDKTRLAVSKSGNLVHSVTNQIEHILSDKEKLRKRTQLKRTDYEIVGQKHKDLQDQNSNHSSPEVYDVNIFDDTDLYHHLLRELIEFKSADLTDPVQLGRQWIQLQNLRSKMKRKIDTKATKGRKIRYVVHSKLVNFMAPVDESRWQEEAKTELYGSLFGKNQSVNAV